MGSQLPLLKRGTAPQFLADVYCGETAGWVNMLLGTKVDLGPDPSPPVKGAQQPPLFSARVCCGHGRPSQLLLSSLLLFRLWSSL